jgi:hypothetical protein
LNAVLEGIEHRAMIRELDSSIMRAVILTRGQENPACCRELSRGNFADR